MQIGKGDLEALLANVQPLIPTRPTARADDLEKLAETLSNIEAGLIIVGPFDPGNSDRWTAAVFRLAEMSGWPVLADALSPLRGRAGSIPNLICHYDTILRSAEWAERLVPEAVISIGALPTSKVLREWLVRKSAPTWVIDLGLDNKDGVHREAHPVRVSVMDLAGAMKRNVRKQSEASCEWAVLERRVSRKINRKMQRCGFVFEGKTPWVLSQVLTADTPLVVANSMPVRDMEYFWQKGNGKVEIHFNRGASGIDGTLSTALGVAQASGRAVLLTGDLAFLHDTNGMLMQTRLKGHLTVVLINNRGGGIFETLSIAALDPPFEEYFAMPQEVSFQRLAYAYGVDYEKIRDLDADLPELLREFPKSGIRLLEICCDRKRDHSWREGLFEDIVREL
jgi:2-succinyl-5-enolpyruvyl-6-hydroxy-3-cyclohexene-1-carboxylate synthase